MIPIGEYEVEVTIRTPGAAYRVLNEAHGWKDGTASLDVRATDEHAEAAYNLLRATVITVRVRFDKQGNKEFEVAK